MYKKLVIFLGISMGASSLVHAELSPYEGCYNRALDDGQVALCMKAETNRVLKQIQNVYLTLSQNRAGKETQSETQTIDKDLQQIYKPWMAYRNRFCSLYTKASEHMFGAEEYKKESCLLELTNEHLDSMQSLLSDKKGHVGQLKNPSTTYEECYKKALNNQQLESCMKNETTRLFAQVQQNYFALAQNPQTSEWNNGSGLMAGNLKDTYEYWLDYRDKFCSFYAEMLSAKLGNKSIWQENCLLNLTADQNESLESVLLNANSGGEENDIDEE